MCCWAKLAPAKVCACRNVSTDGNTFQFLWLHTLAHTKKGKRSLCSEKFCEILFYWPLYHLGLRYQIHAKKNYISNYIGARKYQNRHNTHFLEPYYLSFIFSSFAIILNITFYLYLVNTATTQKSWCCIWRIRWQKVFAWESRLVHFRALRLTQSKWKVKCFRVGGNVHAVAWMLWSPEGFSGKLAALTTDIFAAVLFCPPYLQKCLWCLWHMPSDGCMC